MEMATSSAYYNAVAQQQYAAQQQLAYQQQLAAQQQMAAQQQLAAHAAQQQMAAQQAHYAWAQAGQLPAYGQAALFAQQAYGQPMMYPGMEQVTYAQPAVDYAQPAVEECDSVDIFLRELGVEPYEDMNFAWIAEYGLQKEVMPRRWTMHTDTSTGRIYYVDSDSGESSWENPLTECFKAIVDIGRRFLASPTATFFDDQKEELWEQHKRELECWHGPMLDDEGRSYYSNSSLGVSSWHDPREETQFLFELEGNLLEALEDCLFDLGPEDLPTFGCAAGTEPVRTESGAEILTLDDSSSPAGVSRTLTAAERIAQLMGLEASEHQSLFENMISAADHLNDLHRESEEVQKLLMCRKVKERQMRKQRIEEAKDRAIRDEEAVRKALVNAEEEKKAEIARQMREEQQKAEEAQQKKLEEEETARKEAERIAEEEALKEKERAEEAARLAEIERKAEARLRKYEAEKLREEQEKRVILLARLLEVVQGSDLEALRSAFADGAKFGLDEELEPVRKALKQALIQHLQDVVKSRDTKAMQAAVADGAALGLDDALLVPVRKALEDEMALRREEKNKARKAKEELAAQFKDAKDAADFGGAILAAQWRAAVREVAKPIQE